MAPYWRFVPASTIRVASGRARIAAPTPSRWIDEHAGIKPPTADAFVMLECNRNRDPIAIACEIKALLKGRNYKVDGAFTDHAGDRVDEGDCIERERRSGMCGRDERRMERRGERVAIRDIDSRAVSAERLHKANRRWNSSAGDKYSCLLIYQFALVARGEIELPPPKIHVTARKSGV
jgi:hypothetical protein